MVRPHCFWSMTMRPRRVIVLGAIAMLIAPTSAAQAQTKSQPLPPEITGSKLYSYSRWTKVCGRERGNPSAPQICLTMLEVKRQAGSFAAGAALIEGAGDKIILRITVPAEAKREAGARVAVDGDKPRAAKFVDCLPRGCIADFDADREFILRLRGGDTLHLRGTGESGQDVAFRLPLAGFAAANDGAAMPTQ